VQKQKQNKHIHMYQKNAAKFMNKAKLVAHFLASDV